MASNIWDPFLTDRDREVMTVSGYGARGGFGLAPALVVIDVNYNFCGRYPEPLPDAAVNNRNSCGEAAWEAIEHIEELLSMARQEEVPIFYSTNETPRPDGVDSGRWASKNRRRLEDAELQNNRGNEIVDRIAPMPTDILVRKTKPSAFFGTPLISYLVELGIDTLLCCGGTTSGCVRQTVVDGFSHNFYCAVIEEACFDRSEASHAINLFDIDQKYADVISVSHVAEYLQSLPS